MLLFFIVLYRKQQNFFLKEKELLEIRHSQILMENQLELQENIFTQISREIHDNIGQLLSLVRLNINTTDVKNLETKLSHTDEILGRAIGDLRNLSRNLNTNYILEVGLIVAVEKLLESLQKTGQFSTKFYANDLHLTLDNDKTIILFRIIQEIINNIIKHACATSVECLMKRDGNGIHIVICDDGKGFDISILKQPRAGLGINNMIERAKLLPATIDIASKLETGTTFTIII